MKLTLVGLGARIALELLVMQLILLLVLLLVLLVVLLVLVLVKLSLWGRIPVIVLTTKLGVRMVARPRVNGRRRPGTRPSSKHWSPL